MSTPEDIRAQQKSHWDGQGGQTWVEAQAVMDTMFSAIEDQLAETARESRANHILDIGCGTGAVTLAAARAAPAASLTGIDISGPMLALARQRAELQRQRQGATMDAGVWKLPQGEDYYRWALRAGTTTRMTPDEVHSLGLDQLAALQGQMDGLLKGLGMTKGTVGERMTAMGKDPRYLFPNDDAGRAQILSYIDGRLADIRTRLSSAFRLSTSRLPSPAELSILHAEFKNRLEEFEANPGATTAYLPPHRVAWPRCIARMRR